MKIAVLAWGSLIWDRRDLAVEGAFKPIGPALPLEFGRISSGKRLTLVIDEAIGVSCVTYAAPSQIMNLDEALIDLWRREGSPEEVAPTDVRRHGRVGFVDITAGNCSATAMQRHPSAVEAIRNWGHQQGYEAVVWTSLASNFHKDALTEFSVNAAVEYLDRLDKLGLARALNYIWNAPEEIQTPVRTAVSERWPLREH